MTKLRNVRSKQWNRYLKYLCKVGGGNTVCPPGMIRWYNREVAKEYAKIRKHFGEDSSPIGTLE